MASKLVSTPTLAAGRVPGFALSLWNIIRLETLKMLKDPVEVASRSVQPALWLLIFGQAFDHLHAIPTGGVSYLAFLTPGILAQSITFVSIFNGLTVIWEKDMGLMQKVLSTPIRRSALVLGKMLAASSRSFFQLLVVVALGLLMGLRFEWGPLRVLGLLGFTVLGSAFFTGLSMVIASIVRTRDRMMGIGQLVTMPLFFASSALYPLDAMPGWLRAFAVLNPMTYLVTGFRGIMLDPAWTGVPLDAAVLGACGVAALAVATWLYPKLLI